MTKNTLIPILLFFNPLCSHIARQYFEYNKINIKNNYNLTNYDLSLYDSSFLITYSTSLLGNGILCNKLQSLNYKIIHLQIFLLGSSVSIFVFNNYFINKTYNLIMYNIHALFTSALWPISFSITMPLIKNNFFKCLWTINGPLGEFIACNFNNNYIPSILYIIIILTNSFIFIIHNYYEKKKDLLNIFRFNLINNSNIDNSNIDNSNNITTNSSKNVVIDLSNNIIIDNNHTNNFNVYKYLELVNYSKSNKCKKISKITLLCLLSFNIKFITYSTSNWLPNISKKYYYYYSLYSILGTSIIGLITLYYKNFNKLLLIFSFYSIIFYIIKQQNIIIYILLGIGLSIMSTLISILICEKNKDLIGGLALMTSLMDFSGTIMNALMQLIVYNNYYSYLIISSITLTSLSFINLLF